MPRTLTALCLLLATVVVGCGEDSPEPPPAETTPQTVQLTVAVDLPDTLRRLAETWAAERRARIAWTDPADAAAATLAEVDAVTARERARAGTLRPFPEAPSGSVWLGTAGVHDERVWGLPWRARITALAVEGAATWPSLGRRGERLVVLEGTEVDAFLALAAASGAGIEPGTPHDADLTAEPAVEALAFLRRVMMRAAVRTADDPWPDDATAAVVPSTFRDELPPGLAIRPLPGPDADDEGRVLARPRVLVVPAAGDHGDLGVELAVWLADPARSVLLHREAGRGIALHRDLEASDADPAGAWLALRSRACLPPTLGPDAAAWQAALPEVVAAAVERRRSPRAALEETWNRRPLPGDG
jgi:hypothetical protein